MERPLSPKLKAVIRIQINQNNPNDIANMDIVRAT
jgi:hypothetical protein